MRKTLLPFTARQVAKSRRALKRLDLDPEGFTKVHMYTLKKVLQRLPRHVTTLTEQRYTYGMGKGWVMVDGYSVAVRHGMVTACVLEAAGSLSGCMERYGTRWEDGVVREWQCCVTERYLWCVRCGWEVPRYM